NRTVKASVERPAVLGEYSRRGYWRLVTSGAFSWVGGHPTARAGNAFLYYSSPRWFAEVVPHFVSPGFRDDLGFIPFTDYKGVIADGYYATEWRKGPVRSMSAGWNTNNSHHYDGRLFRQERGADFNLQTRSDYALDFSWQGGRFE